MLAYYNGDFVEKNSIHLSPDDRGFLFADGIYDVLRSYHGQLFRLPEHIKRLSYCARQLRLPVSDLSFLGEVARQLIERNQLGEAEAAVYLQITRGAARRGHAFPVPAPELTVYGNAFVLDETAARNKRQHGISAISLPDTRWARCDIKTTGLTANVLANQQAVEQGASEAILVRDGVLLEGSHTNFLAVVDGAVRTAPLSNYILAGITRKVTLELCQAEQIPVVERPIFTQDACRASEMLVVGTTTEIMPIVRFDSQPVGDGRPGPLTRRLQQAFARQIAPR